MNPQWIQRGEELNEGRDENAHTRIKSKSSKKDDVILIIT